MFQDTFIILWLIDWGMKSNPNPYIPFHMLQYKLQNTKKHWVRTGKLQAKHEFHLLLFSSCFSRHFFDIFLFLFHLHIHTININQLTKIFAWEEGREKPWLSQIKMRTILTLNYINEWKKKKKHYQRKGLCWYYGLPSCHINKWWMLSIANDQRVPTSLALMQDYIKDSKPGVRGEEI